MELQQMRYVVEVAATRSFTRAAERCFVTQSALSHQIAALERELGQRLFIRSSRGVRLTEAGEAFLPPARSALASAQQAVDAVAAEPDQLDGTVRIGIIPTVVAVRVPRLLASFRAAHPAVRVELEMGNSDDLVAKIRRGDLDVALLGLQPGAEPRGVGYRELAVDHHVAVLPRAHRLAARTRLRLGDLAEDVFVDFPAGTSGRAQSDVAFRAAGVDRDVAFEVDTAGVMLGLVAEGLAVALLTPGAVPAGMAGVSTVTVADGPRRAEYVAWDLDSPRRVARALLTVLDGEASV
ncbi:LysR substrate-binding domain-containing protein [Microbacterium galbinum]|jgi:DNA-binding transcriptional LysR family regulator|uniref:LysR family transcriptional regulator n=1 Tax=Microbacterium galbinum TaxID=2851646 RepID=A0ABY4IVI0_9MICO|nr:LysR substrate-binding domain-containing protein [Microbacterium galbinum]UPL15488.1 LysR family transcriptional regulator [Microbacterium galbinum]